MFWEIFLRLCNKKGVKPNRVAKEVGIKSSGTVTAWKNGATPQDNTIIALCDYFGVDRDYLLGATSEACRDSTEYRLRTAEEKYEKETDPERKYELALEIDGLRESLSDLELMERLQDAPNNAKAELSDEAAEIAKAFDKADERTKEMVRLALQPYIAQIFFKQTAAL